MSDFANLANAQRLNLLRQVEMKKHAWLDREMARILPPDLYRAAHSTLATTIEEGKVRGWLEEQGYEIRDVWKSDDLGAILLKNGKVVSQLKIEVERRAFTTGAGNVETGQAPPPS